ncbi:hypothetical protein HUW62_04560 [Myxococcus sp. AM011]|uniref:hypothetical protein n=1 Tax=Myxococcus sp. AM011 TaxID=2745200 RepID=UPI001594FF76|nr:hypothetical protein [Myxococcus sp. AM011]NVJ20494.1 hypothetical protein [Myxococcus sp. AM011]
MDKPTKSHDATEDTVAFPGLETVFLVGSGIDHNGWGPVLAAINEQRPEARIEADPDAANYFFATHVYQRRFLERNKSHHSVNQEINTQLISQWTDFDLQLKKSISTHLAEATAKGEMHLRDAFMQNHHSGKWGKHVFITTNWDMLLERQGCKPSSVLHVHGSIETPSLLYLPSEVADEPFRATGDHEQMGRLMATMWKSIAQAPRLVVYGLSLSALDVELGHILSVGLGEHNDGNPCEVHIFDCSDQVEKVERRVRMFLTGETKVQFVRRPLHCGSART